MYISKNGAFLYVQCIKENNDFEGGIALGDTFLLLSHSRYNKVSLFKWTMGYSYSMLAQDRPIICRTKTYEYSFLSNLKHDIKYSKDYPNRFYSVVNHVSVYRIDADTVNIENSKKHNLIKSRVYKSHF